jgi:hypothetical protein
MEGVRYRFLFGVGGEHHGSIAGLERGDRVSLERSGEEILVNRMPVKKFYQRTIDGLVDMAGAGWKKIAGAG